MEVKLPKTINDLRIHHLKGLLDDKYIDVSEDLPDIDKLNLKLKFVSSISGVPETELMRVDIKDLNKMYNHCSNLFRNIDFKAKPSKEITIKGKSYKLIDPDKVATGWHTDWSSCDINEDPVKIACLCYIPKNSNYSELDFTGNLKSRIADRYNDFKEDFPLLLFMQVSGFFLQNYLELIKQLEARLEAKAWTERLLSNLFGKSYSTN